MPRTDTRRWCWCCWTVLHPSLGPENAPEEGWNHSATILDLTLLHRLETNGSSHVLTKGKNCQLDGMEKMTLSSQRETWISLRLSFTFFF